jgi:glycosyltransferase involved in cell wall biosynthesis
LPKLPKISIITPSYNQGQYIEQTILSIIDQGYENIELIIIDGGSSDNTVEVIKKYQDRITYWISEKDNGQADAINKGLKVATGEVFNWINSDDYLESGALYEIGTYFNNNPDKNILCGFTRCFYDDDNSTSHEYRMGVKKSVADTIVGVEMNQPGSFYRMSAVKKIGGVNESLRYVFDDELWFRYLCMYGMESIGFTEKRLAEFRLHKSSKSIGEGFALFAKEIQSVYLDIAQQSKAPEWLVDKMKLVTNSDKYISAGTWDMCFLEKERFFAAFATKYINTFYLAGEKAMAKEALKMIIKYGYFKWNRMMVSLYLKFLLVKFPII